VYTCVEKSICMERMSGGRQRAAEVCPGGKLDDSGDDASMHGYNVRMVSQDRV